MSAIYDNWERLVAATIKRQELWELFHSDSRATSISSLSSDFSFFSYIPDFPYPSSSLWYPIAEDGVYRWGYSAHDPEVKGFDKTETKKSITVAPEEILVNGKPLTRKELLLLQTCLVPPKDLVPGDYWYDKHSGFWGKLGQKPWQIISSYLDVGGRVQEDASNGKTRVYVNAREITRVEVRLLKFAGVGCRRGDYIWLYDDGRYEEEGANHIRGSIWSKPGVKLLCYLLSLPYLPKSAPSTSGESLNLEQGPIQKLLVVGYRGSGTSTLFNQALFRYKDIPFLKGELEHIKLFIQTNLYRYVCMLLEGRKRFEEESMSESDLNGDGRLQADNCGNMESAYSLNPRLNAISEWLVNVMASKTSEVFDASFIRASSPLVSELLNSTALQQTFIRRDELECIIPSGNYFLERAGDMLGPDYKPSQEDILHSEDFFPPSPSYTTFTLRRNVDDEYIAQYQLIRSTSISSSDGDEDENTLGIYEGVRVVILCVSLNDYDQFVLDEYGESVNKMVYARDQYLKRLVARPFLEGSEVLLLFTYYDLFEKKIQRIPLNDQCEWFDDFPALIGQPQSGEVGFRYISAKFKRFYADLTTAYRKMYAARVNCLDALSVDAALRYAAEISKWGEEKGDYDYEEGPKSVQTKPVSSKRWDSFEIKDAFDDSINSPFYRHAYE